MTTSSTPRPRGLHSFAATFALGMWIVFAVLGMYLILIARAHAHEAPAGWSYDSSCCSNRDCAPFPAKEVRTTPSGYQLTDSGETIAYADRRIRVSKDGEFHVCRHPTEPRGRAICLYVPPPSY